MRVTLTYQMRDTSVIARDASSHRRCEKGSTCVGAMGWSFWMANGLIALPAKKAAGWWMRNTLLHPHLYLRPQGGTSGNAI
jgi:hypothetical protein